MRVNVYHGCKIGRLQPPYHDEDSTHPDFFVPESECVAENLDVHDCGNTHSGAMIMHIFGLYVKSAFSRPIFRFCGCELARNLVVLFSSIEGGVMGIAPGTTEAHR